MHVGRLKNFPKNPSIKKHNPSGSRQQQHKQKAEKNTSGYEKSQIHFRL